MTKSRQVVLARRPSGLVSRDDFRIETVSLPPVSEGEIEITTLHVSIDPAIRGWLDDRPSYLPPVALGEPVRSLGLARVTQSRHADYAEGDILRGFVGWRERQVVRPEDSAWDRITPAKDLAITHHLGVLGMTGLTAWAGVHDILEPRPGQTVLVSGASGAVGAVAVQLAKAAGARVLGIAGGAENCAMVRSLGAGAVIDRKAPDWREHLSTSAPDGIDGLFENAGGPMFEASIALLNNHARIALCGLIDGYNLAERPPGPGNFGMFVAKRIRCQGFIALDYMPRSTEIEGYLRKMIDTGELDAPQTIVRGIDHLAGTFVESFTRGSKGKLIVDLTP